MNNKLEHHQQSMDGYASAFDRYRTEFILGILGASAVIGAILLWAAQTPVVHK